MFAKFVSFLFLIWTTTVHTSPAAMRSSTEQHSDSAEFWITIDLLNVEWKLECLSTAYCIEPELKIIKTNPVNEETSSFGWILDQNFGKLFNRTFVSHWAEGSPQNIEVAVEVIGIDPKYRFQRTCDQAPATKVFALQAEHSGNSNPENLKELGRMIVELRGRCFNATLTVQKHIGRCPWCIEIERSTAVENESFDNGNLEISRHNLIIFGCIGGALWLLTASAPVLTLWLLQWFRKSRKQKKAIERPSNWKIVVINENDHASLQMTHQSNSTSGVTSLASTPVPDEQLVNNNTDTVTDATPPSGKSDHTSPTADSTSLESFTDSLGYSYVIN